MVRIVLILSALFVVGLAGAFLLYVSVLSIFTAVVIIIGLVATLVLGYWAGSNSLDQSASNLDRPWDASVINAPSDVTLSRHPWPVSGGTQEHREPQSQKTIKV
jgi:hypothetical protein